MLRLAPPLAILVLAGPIFFGLAATLLPAFGYFPALGGERFSLQPFTTLMEQPGLARSVALSFATGIITTAISLMIVAGFVAAWSNTRLFRFFQHLISPLLSVPHAAAAFGLAFLIAPSGWIMRMISPELTGFTRPPDWLILNDPLGLAMMAGLVMKEIPFLFLVTLSALPQTTPRRYARVAVTLGYGRMAAILFAVWPRVYPQIRLAVFAVIAYASSVVDVALILGPTNPPPLAVRLLGWMNDPDLSMRFQASAGAVLQLAVTGAALLFWIVIEKLVSALSMELGLSGRRWRADALVRYISGVTIGVSALAVAMGLVVLALWSIASRWQFTGAFPEALTFRTWERQLPSLAMPLQTTLLVGIAATLFSLAIVLACLEREARTGRAGGSRALAFVYLPLIVPQVSFVFGLQLFFLTLGQSGTFWVLVAVHGIFVLPYVFLSLSDPWRAWDKRYAQIAHALGAGSDQVFWRIRLPMLTRSILVACAVGFAVSVGQYLPTVLIGAGRLPTITTEAVALASGGDRRVIGVFAFVQMALPFVAFAVATLVPAILFSNRQDMKAAD